MSQKSPIEMFTCGVAELLKVAEDLTFSPYNSKQYLINTQKYLQYGFKVAERETEKENEQQLKLKGI